MTLLLVSTSLLGLAAPANPVDPTGKTVAFIQVAGTDKVDANIVMAAIRTKPGDVVTAEKIRQDLRLIDETGYFADVNADVTIVPEGAKIVYTVKENPVLKNISVQGNTVVKTEKVLSFITLKKGAVVNNKILLGNLRNIEEYYKGQGYILAKTGDVKLPADGNLALPINEGLVEDIVVKGNTKTKSFVVTREMKLKKGQPFNSKDARRSMQKLYNLGYFEDVNIKLLPGKEPGGTIVEIALVEQKTGTFSIGGGYSNSDGLVGIITVGDKNFRGRGDDLSLHWQFGGNTGSMTNFSVSYTRPWLDSKQTQLGVTVYNMLTQGADYDVNGDLISSYDKRDRGFEISLGRPTNDNLWHFITFKNRREDWVAYSGGPENYDPDNPYPVVKNANYAKENFGITRSITLSRVFDTRDSAVNSQHGSRYVLSAEYAGLGGDFNFTKYTVESRHYQKVGKSQILAWRGIGGYGFGAIPLQQQYSVGGATNLRGYRDDQFRGNRMITSTLEYRFPVAKRVQGAFFVDTGKAWQSDDGMNGFKTGVGVGIMVNLPIGPVRIDYAVGSQGGRTHFGFGGQF